MRIPLIVLYTSGFLVSMCCKSPVVPPERQKTPRDYTWSRTAFGVASDHVTPLDMWGSTPQNVYLVAGSSLLFTGKIWHFNGNQWTDITPVYVESYNEAFPGKQVHVWTPWGVLGSGPNDIWIVGARDTSGNSDVSGFVMRYNGQVWREIPIQGSIHLYCIGGEAPNDLWVAGSYGKIFHYNGSTWTPYAVPDSIHVGHYMGRAGGKTYLLGANLGSGDGREYLSLLEWDGTSWTIAEVAQGPPHLTFDVPNIIEQELFTAVGTTVRKRTAPNVWGPVFEIAGMSLLRVEGLSESNMVAVGGPGEHVVHYNGENAMRITQFSDPAIRYFDVLMFENEVFIAGEGDNFIGYVMHGK